MNLPLVLAHVYLLDLMLSSLPGTDVYGVIVFSELSRDHDRASFSQVRDRHVHKLTSRLEKSPFHVQPLPTSPAMAPLADFLLAYAPLPSLPYYLTSYVKGVSPLSTQPAVVAALVSYLVIVFGIREVMKNQQPLRLQFLFQPHNIILSSGSALLLVLMVEEIAPIVWKHGLFYGMCNTASWTPVRVSFVFETCFCC